MKQITKKQKIGIAILAAIILVGLVIIFTMGFNFDLRFQATKKVELYLGKDFEISDIKQIAKETIPNQTIIIQKVEVFEDTVSIIAKEITEEQKQNLVTKVNEKYGTALSVEDTEIASIPNTRGRDLIKPYILPFVITTAIILIYMAARYKKIGAIKTVVKVSAILVIAQALLISLIAIARIPVGRLTMPMAITVYILTLAVLTTKYEKQLKYKKEDEKK